MVLGLSNKILIAVAVPVIFMLGFVSFLYQFVADAERVQLKEMERRELVSHFNAVLALTMERATILLLARFDPELRNQAAAILPKVHAEVDIMQKLASRDSEKNQAWLDIANIFNLVDADLEKSRKLYDQGDMIAAARVWSRVHRHSNKLYQLAGQLSSGELEAQQADIARVKEFGSSMRIFLFTSLTLSVLTAFALALYFIRGSLSRMHHLTLNSTRLAAGLPPDKVLSGNDEFAGIDGTLHALYASLETMRRKERAILENASDIICTIDHTLVFTDMNQACSRIWERSADYFVGRRVMDLIVESEKSAVAEKFQALIHGQPSGKLDVSVVKADGSLCECEWSCTWSEEQSQLYCVVRDVTQKRRLERMKQDFMAMVSHDLRTPLTVIQLTHAMIESESSMLSSSSRDSLRRSQDSASRLIGLVNNLLDLEKLDSGQMELYCDELRAADVIQSALDELLELAKARSVVLVAEAPQDCRFWADRERIVQVLINLISNALKFSPPQSQIVVKAQTLNLLLAKGEQSQNADALECDSLMDDDGPSTLVKFSVEDEGPGIPAGKAGILFEKFKQGEWNANADAKGTGLGLSICKAIVQAHHGEIGVDTDLERGCRFWFSLPGFE